MATRYYFTKTLSGLAPADDEARDHLKKYQIGDTLAAEVVKPREHKSLKRYWLLLKIIMQSTDKFKSRDSLHDYLKIRAGHCDSIVAGDGVVYFVAKSIDYATLDENGFMEVWRRIVDVVCEEILPGVSERQLEEEIHRLCGLSNA